MRRIFCCLICLILILGFSSTIWSQNGSKTDSEPKINSDKSNNETKTNNSSNGSQDEGEAIKVGTTLINVPIIANDKDGHYIEGLQQEDFLVYENGTKQEIALFAAETVPINVVLLIDMSSSTRRSTQAIKRAAKAFVDNIRPSDRVKLIAFTYDIDELSKLTNKKDVLYRAIEELSSGGSTRLYDAVEYCARVIFNKIEGRKALILLTDGVDSSSYKPSQLTVREIVDSNALVYVVKYPTANQSFSISSNNGPINAIVKNNSIAKINYNNRANYNNKDNFDFIKELTEQTGGAIIPSSSFELLTDKMKSVADQLRHFYSIGYYPANAIENGGYRKIELKLYDKKINNKISLHYKKGYNASEINEASKTKK